MSRKLFWHRKTPDLQAVRQNLGLNQQDFYRPFGVTQSAGSRYERGRRLPEPLRKLIRLACGWGSKKTILARMKRFKSL